MLLGAMTASLAAVTAASSCQAIAGLDGNFQPAPDGGPAGDAGADTGPDTGPAGCVSATYPDPPGIPDDGNDAGTISLAVHTVDLGDMGTVPGYDLDHTCTCTGDAGPTCIGRSMTPSTYCDAPGGVDNQFAKVVQLIEIPLGSTISSSTFTAKAEAGYWTLIILVTGYNGEKDDPSVQVALYPCAGLGAMPQWDGTDSWPVLATAVDMGAPVYVSNGAYVADHTLVATVPKVPVTFAGEKETLTLTLSGAVLTGQLVQSNGVWRIIQGTLAARFALTDFFQALSTYRDNNGMPLCSNSGFIYDTAKTSVCNDADILVDPTQPISTTCDALSFGMGFTADPAVLGPVVPVPTPTPGCTAAMGDPATDSCPP